MVAPGNASFSTKDHVWNSYRYKKGRFEEISSNISEGRVKVDVCVEGLTTLTHSHTVLLFMLNVMSVRMRSCKQVGNEPFVCSLIPDGR